MYKSNEFKFLSIGIWFIRIHLVSPFVDPLVTFWFFSSSSLWHPLFRLPCFDMDL